MSDADDSVAVEVIERSFSNDQAWLLWLASWDALLSCGMARGLAAACTRF